jgi:signal transduction histidine kinase
MVDNTNPIKILVVEDDPVNRILMEGLIKGFDIQVGQTAYVESLSDTMEHLNGNVFDVVLLDLNLPDSSGLDTLDSVLKQAPYMAVVVVTGEHGEDLGLQAVAKGAQEYMIKASFNKETLSRSIRYAIERKRAEEKLNNMQNQLIQNEKLASIGQLAAGVAHEMNTPMGFVASNFATLQKYMNKLLHLFSMYEDLLLTVETGTKEERIEKMQEVSKHRKEIKIDFILDDIKELFEESKEGIDRVTSIIQNLRDFSRIDQAEDFEEYNLNNGIKATLTIAKNEIKYDADIKTEFSELPVIFCNSGRINQVFLNILVNAAQAIKSQERDGKGTITIRTYSTDDEVVCEITDDGPGIPSDKISKVFDPFFTTKPVGKGTGLGLSVSYDIIVNKHKGDLLIDSQVGKGTRFTVKLPINRKNPDVEKEIEKNGKENSIICGR